MTGWKTKPLGELCDIARGGSPRPIQAFLTNAPDGINWVKISDATASGKYIYSTAEKIKPAGASRSRVVYDGDFLLSNSMSFGRPYIMRTTGCIHDGWLVLSNYQDSFSQDFLYYLLGSPQVFAQFDRLAAGSTVRNLNIDLASRVVVPIPPTEEQRRIVAILDGAFDGIATAKGNSEKNLQNTREWSTRQLTTALGAASAGGRSEALETLVAPSCTLSYGIVQPGDEVADGLPVVRPVDLGGKIVCADGLKRIDPSLARSYARTTLEGNDLLLCVRGTTGTVAMADPTLAGANVTRGIVPIRFDPLTFSQELGYYLLRSEPVQAQIRAKTYGAALMQINIGDLRKIVVLFPPLDRQAAVVEQLDAIQDAADQLIDVYARKLAALDELRKSLLHQAFSGALTARSIDQQLETVA